VSDSDKDRARKAAEAALREYVDAATVSFDVFLPLFAAFAIANKTRSHTRFLDLVYQLLCLRFAHERTGRRFTKMGTRAYSKEDRATTLAMLYISSGKSQEEFARQAAEYNSGQARPYRLGTQTTDEKAMLRALKRALHNHPEYVANKKKWREIMIAGGYFLRGHNFKILS
jgi:hypothetical protein